MTVAGSFLLCSLIPELTRLWSSTKIEPPYLEVLQAQAGCTIEAANLAGDDREDLLHDLSRIVYSMCARLSGLSGQTADRTVVAEMEGRGYNSLSIIWPKQQHRTSAGMPGSGSFHGGFSPERKQRDVWSIDAIGEALVEAEQSDGAVLPQPCGQSVSGFLRGREGKHSGRVMDIERSILFSSWWLCVWIRFKHKHTRLFPLLICKTGSKGNVNKRDRAVLSCMGEDDRGKR